jgi:hypothetical protein
MTFAADTNTELAPGNDILPTDGAIANFFLGEDNPKNRGRVRALMCHIMPVEHRMPSCMMGGQRTSFKSWITRWIAECREREEARARDAAEAAGKVADDARHIRRTGGRPAVRRSAPATRYPLNAAADE